MYVHTHTHTYTHTQTHTHTHNDCSRNWVLILAGAEILWEEEGFKFGFKRGQGWAVQPFAWWLIYVLFLVLFCLLAEVEHFPLPHLPREYDLAERNERNVYCFVVNIFHLLPWPQCLCALFDFVMPTFSKVPDTKQCSSTRSKYASRFVSFLNASLLFKCRFVAWSSKLPLKFSCCVFCPNK